MLALQWNDEGGSVLTVTRTGVSGSALHVLKAQGGGAFERREVAAHAGDVRGAAWAPSELSGGLVAAACGDGHVRMWEQRLGSWGREHALAPACSPAPALTALAFAPPHLGLQLAVGDEGGLVRVLACDDPAEPVREGAWALRDELQAGDGAAVTALAWGRAPPGGAALLATAASPPGRAAEVLVWARTSADAPPRPPRWVALLRLEGHAGAVRSLSWAPALGRPSQLLATLGEGRLCVWAVAPAEAGAGAPPPAAAPRSRAAAARERAEAYLAAGGRPAPPPPAPPPAPLRGALQLPGATVAAELLVAEDAPPGSARVEWDGSGAAVACGDETEVRVLRQGLAGDFVDD
jgi:hypothetical protein